MLNTNILDPFTASMYFIYVYIFEETGLKFIRLNAGYSIGQFPYSLIGVNYILKTEFPISRDTLDGLILPLLIRQQASLPQTKLTQKDLIGLISALELPELTPSY